MTTLKKGDLIKGKFGTTHKVIEVLGEILFISPTDSFNTCWAHQTEEQLKENGFTWDTPAWEPEIDEMYWYITISDSGAFSHRYWVNDRTDHARRDFLGIYQTKELAEAALLEIRRKLGK